MTKQELIKLRKILKCEIKKRNRINELLENDLVKEFITLTDSSILSFEIDNWSIIEEILKNYKITETNEILVCTGNFITRCSICYQETEYYEEPIEFGSNYSEYRIYEDIENGKKRKCYLDEYVKRIKGIYVEKYPLVSELEKEYIVLNPHNSNIEKNGIEEVRKDFFLTAVESGQYKAKQLLLKKYTQMK